MATSHNRPSMPVVSVIIPTYNRARYLREAVESVLAQTYTDWELIVVDDGSTDETRRVVQSYVSRDPRVFYRAQANRGEGAARNTGIQLARSRYVAFLDDDDLWLPEKLAWQLEALAHHPEAPWVFGDGQLIADDGRVLRPVLPQQRPAFDAWVTAHGTADDSVSVGPFYDVLLTGNCLSVPSVIAERKCFQRVGLFNESPHLGEDYDMWLRIARTYPVILLQRPLIQVRVHEGAMSGGQDVRAYRWHEATARVLAAHLPQIPSERRAGVRRVIAGCCRTAGWHFLHEGDHARARRLLLTSLRYRWNQPRTAAYLIASCLPPSWLSKLRERKTYRVSSVNA